MTGPAGRRTDYFAKLIPWNHASKGNRTMKGNDRPDPEKNPEPLRGLSKAFLWEFLENKKTLRASKEQFSSERLSEGFPPLVLHLRSSWNHASILLAKSTVQCLPQIPSHGGHCLTCCLSREGGMQRHPSAGRAHWHTTDSHSFSPFFAQLRNTCFHLINQGRILAVWILSAKLPNSDLNFAVDFWVDFFSCFFQGKRPEKIHQKSPAKFTQDFVRKNSPRISAEAFS